jgi:hypothetical protein
VCSITKYTDLKILWDEKPQAQTMHDGPRYRIDIKDIYTVAIESQTGNKFKWTHFRSADISFIRVHLEPNIKTNAF